MEKCKKGGFCSEYIMDKVMKHPEYIILPVCEKPSDPVYMEWYKRINREDKCKNIKLRKRVYREYLEEESKKVSKEEEPV
jgi:hypothetical protein